MIKSWIARVFAAVYKYRNLFVYFTLPNLTRKAFVKFETLPSIDQKFIVSGLGKILIGKNCNFGYKLGGFNYNGAVEIQPRYRNAVIKIGDYVSTNNNVCIIAANRIEIGDDSLIGQNVTIMDFEAHAIDPSKRRQLGEIGEVIIKNNVWIGNNVIILRGTYIGSNSIIAAGAVVKGNFPDNVIIGGVPAKVIKQIGVV